MPKDIMVSFRVTEALSDNLKKLAGKNNTTVSGFVDAALRNALNAPDTVEQDRRGFPRQRQALAAVICAPGGLPCAARMTDIALGGVGLSMPERGSGMEAMLSRRFAVAFAISALTAPVVLLCQGIWVRQGAGRCQMGAAFHDASLESYQALRTWLA